ncbi:MAG: hypothetical protein GAK28_02965 [Luteibacter sp.]|uniref:hypothetical protein n=1 Tax=Luteibacter sp. TaxID=1886636 RepID=UPI001383296B|nr:hypothetical protein [Luteibacter sp.]KAF1005750.1 MAG: hypothetical protein GAK28_02965 [Luteibacter sp.]
MTRCRGGILIFVLCALAILALVGAFVARDAASRLAAVRAFREATRREFMRCDVDGGQPQCAHATIDDGAAGASSNEAHHGSQAIPPGRDAGVGSGSRR